MAISLGILTQHFQLPTHIPTLRDWVGIDPLTHWFRPRHVALDQRPLSGARDFGRTRRVQSQEGEPW